MLLGYGVALSVEAYFGFPRAQVYESAQDLLELNSIVFLETFSTLNEAMGTWAFYWLPYEKLWVMLAVLTGAFILVFLAIWQKDRWRRWLPAGNAWRRWLAAPSEKSRENRALAAGCAAALAWIWTAPLLLPLLLIGVMYVMALFAAVPILGMSAGKSYIQKYVVQPQGCSPVQDLQALRAAARRSGESGATCVRVSGGGEAHGGRVIYATSKAVLLLDASGTVRRIDTGGKVVEMVEDI